MKVNNSMQSLVQCDYKTEIKIRSEITYTECISLASRYNLAVLKYEGKDHIECAHSCSRHNYTGIYMKIRSNVLILKVNLFNYLKLRSKEGILTNDNTLTENEAKLAFEMLLFELGLTKNKNIILPQYAKANNKQKK